MRVLKPVKNSVVCKKVNKSKENINLNGILLSKQFVDIYQILDFSVDEKYDFSFNIGDYIVSQSTGDEIEVNDNEIIYMFQPEHIMCKVVDFGL